MFDLEDESQEKSTYLLKYDELTHLANVQGFTKN